MIPYWLELRLVVILFLGVFLYIVWRGNGKSLRIIPEAFGDFFKKLWNMLFRRIEDEEAYKANEEERRKNKEYIKNKKK